MALTASWEPPVLESTGLWGVLGPAVEQSEAGPPVLGSKLEL